MNTEEFKEFAKAAVDYIADYTNTIRDRPVAPSVSPGYLEKLIPNEVPQKGESWKDVLKDVDLLIVPGLTHWTSPYFHSYYPAGHSHPSTVGELMSAAFGCVGINWLSSPACIELELNMMNWLCKLLHLPDVFLNCSEGSGGGAILGSASEANFLTLTVAKEKTLKRVKDHYPCMTEAEIQSKLVAYSSDQSNSSVEKAGILGTVRMRLLPTDNNGKLRAATLIQAIKQDKNDGLIPFYMVACFGTTTTCAFDDLTELGPICSEEKMWVHVDAAYAGAAFSCPENRYMMAGIKFADSFVFNPHKWMLTNVDCSALWVKNTKDIEETLEVNRIYLKDPKTIQKPSDSIPEYRHWNVPLGRRFKALKLWFVLRIYGVEGIQEHIRKQIYLAQYFEKLVRNDCRFEICSSALGLVTFRIKGDNCLTEQLLNNISESKKIFLGAGHFHKKLIMRYIICSIMTERSDVDFSWKVILDETDKIIPLDEVKFNDEFIDQLRIDS